VKLTNIEKFKTENNKQYTYRVLKENIMNLNLKPGESISELDLANFLNVSRTPIREAISTLKSENLIKVFPQKGTFVAQIDLDFVEEAFFMRNVLEHEVLRLACHNFSSEALLELEKNLHLQEFQAKFEENQIELFKLDNKFHQIIYEEVNKKKVWKAIKQMNTHYDRVRLIDAIEKTNLEKILSQHKQIIEIIKNKDFDKIDEIVLLHLSNFKHKISYFKEIHPEFFIEN
jgi:DNA-binding GntR family transcriptional regulator